MKIASVVGARPNFIKYAPLSRELRKGFDEFLIHTGQHYDYEMNKVFFDDLGIPEQDYPLGVGSGNHGEQTGEMLKGTEEVLIKEEPDLVVKYLVQSAPLILKEIPNVSFLIVGEGQMKEELINLAERTGVFDKFIFTGAVPYEEVPEYINASNVCVVPKIPLKSGYSPLKLYEYMACGKPVVASRISGFEILEQNNAGILVEPENPEKLAKAILKLLKRLSLK